MDFELHLFDAEPTGHQDNDALALVTADVAKLIASYTFSDATKKLIGTGINQYKPDNDSNPTDEHKPQKGRYNRYTDYNRQDFWILWIILSARLPPNAVSYLDGLACHDTDFSSHLSTVWAWPGVIFR